MKTRMIFTNDKGMSMMELMTVVVIIGVMAAMAVPSFMKEMPQIRTKGAVRDVVSSLRTARSMAISTKVPCGVGFDAKDSSYFVFLDKNNPQEAKFSAGDSVVSSNGLSKDITVQYQTFPNDAIVFQPDGSASGSGLVTLTTADHSLTYTVDVLASTGRVRMVEGYSGGN
ncbi:MAG: GspH/FimT family pseudopilin [candidate division Zixibacteria bacterium]|nr:GspH/FimT family pseudopilin [candidate division Zixibacteria bacterium]